MRGKIQPLPSLVATHPVTPTHANQSLDMGGGVWELLKQRKQCTDSTYWNLKDLLASSSVELSVTACNTLNYTSTVPAQTTKQRPLHLLNNPHPFLRVIF